MTLTFDSWGSSKALSTTSIGAMNVQLRSLYPRETTSTYCGGREDGSQSQSGHGNKEKIPVPTKTQSCSSSPLDCHINDHSISALIKTRNISNVKLRLLNIIPQCLCHVNGLHLLTDFQNFSELATQEKKLIAVSTPSFVSWIWQHVSTSKGHLQACKINYTGGFVYSCITFWIKTECITDHGMEWIRKSSAALGLHSLLFNGYPGSSQG